MCLFFDQSILVQRKLCKILNPFIFLIMFIDHRQFNDLVQIEYKVDNHNRQFQDKCADASQRNSDTADMASWLNFPSMIASHAPTRAVMNC